MKNISSEQELKEMLEEGKITEEEYAQLLDAMQKQTQPPPQQIDSAPPKTKPKHKLGITAFILMIAGLTLPLPLIIIARAFSLKIGIIIIPPPFLLLLTALILGIVAFSSGWGKATAICIPLLMLTALLLLLVIGLFVHRRVATPPQFQYAELQNPPPMTALLLKHYPMDSLEGLLTQSDITLDKNLSADGNGSIKFESKDSKKILRLFEFEDVQKDNILLSYSAKLRSENLHGKAYLEMWCDIPGRGEFFSRSIEQPVTGSTEWTNISTPFRLEPGQVPANIKLNLIVEGTGTVWIDDIKLLASSLN
jgi:hypothetical protein